MSNEQTALPIKPMSAIEYVRTVTALVVILRAVEKKMPVLRAHDDRPHHVGALAHLRQARRMEEELLQVFKDPHGMFMTVMAEAGALLENLSAKQALALLEEGK